MNKATVLIIRNDDSRIDLCTPHAARYIKTYADWTTVVRVGPNDVTCEGCERAVRLGEKQYALTDADVVPELGTSYPTIMNDADRLAESKNPVYARIDLHNFPYGHGGLPCPFGFDHRPVPDLSSQR